MYTGCCNMPKCGSTVIRKIPVPSPQEAIRRSGLLYVQLYQAKQTTCSELIYPFRKELAVFVYRYSVQRLFFFCFFLCSRNVKFRLRYQQIRSIVKILHSPMTVSQTPLLKRRIFAMTGKTLEYMRTAFGYCQSENVYRRRKSVYANKSKLKEN